MSILEQKPLTLSVPLREEPPGAYAWARAASFWNWSFVPINEERLPERSFRCMMP